MDLADTIPLRLNKKIIIESQKIMLEQDFPFKNDGIFFVISAYKFIQRWNALESKQGKIDFKNEILNDISHLKKNEFIHPNAKGIRGKT